MAVFAVAFDGTRVNAADAITGWAADGVTPEVEADFFYQGTGSISAQVKTTEAGFTYTSASQNMSGRSWLCKVYSGKVAGLDGNGLLVRIGSTSGNYYQYNLFTAATYPIVGGWQLLAIDPNVSQWRSATVGTPLLTATTYWNIRADYSATSRSTNTAMDAIDTIANGTGLTGTGGDGADTDGTFTSFVTADEGTSANRWGVVSTRDGILYVVGTLSIGSATATGFTDSNRVLVFPNQRVTSGFCGLKFSLASASTAISLSNCVFNGRGTLTGSDDTRPDLTVTGTTGTMSATGCTFDGFRLITWTSKPVATDCIYNNSLRVIGAGADIRRSTFAGCTGAADASYLEWNVATDTDGLIDECTFTKGTTATHAIELGTSSPLTVTLRNVNFSGYNVANGQNDSAIHVRRTVGVVTINVVGGTSPSYKSDGATVNISLAPVTVSVTVKDVTTDTAIQNARVLLRAAAGGNIAAAASTSITRVASLATATVTNHGLITNDFVIIAGANQPEYNGIFQVTVLTASTFTFTVSGTPATPATGTITTTGILVTGLTNASGVAQATRVYGATQPFTGTARKASSGDNPLYKPGSISGSVSTTAGFSGTVLLVRDQ